MVFLRRFQFLGALAICWGLALAALYIHPGFWAGFGFVLILLAYSQVRPRRRG